MPRERLLRLNQWQFDCDDVRAVSNLLHLLVHSTQLDNMYAACICNRERNRC